VSDRALRAVGVVKVLGGVRVLRGLDGLFRAGSTHVIEGANGSGKSTLLAVLGGRMQPSKGRVALVDKGALVAEGRGLRAVTGWLGHDLGLYPDLTGYENVALHAQLQGLAPDAVWERWGSQLSMGATRDRRVRVLSRGQRQRVALVRALVGEPAVVLLDEPSTGLDHRSAEVLAELVRDLASREDRIVVAVTHDPVFKERLGGTSWRLEDGQLDRVT
jgi:ABC-type multidrug transport system ATPase subunit